jgi:hypothetical protein
MAGSTNTLAYQGWSCYLRITSRQLKVDNLSRSFLPPKWVVGNSPLLNLQNSSVPLSRFSYCGTRRKLARHPTDPVVSCPPNNKSTYLGSQGSSCQKDTRVSKKERKKKVHGVWGTSHGLVLPPPAANSLLGGGFFLSLCRCSLTPPCPY